jgi:SAM-dependent methyltransferase
VTTRPDEASYGAVLARYYDLDLLDDPGDLPLYEALSRRTGGPILELAAGTGRVAIPLATAGHAVTAVDRDRHMLDRARQGWQRVARDGAAGAEAGTPSTGLAFVEADLIDVALGAHFGLVVLALNSLLLLGERSRQVAALASMARHLRSDGLAVVDIWLPGPDDLALYDGRAILEWLRDDPETTDRVAKLASATFDTATATVTLTQMFDAWPADGGAVRRVSRVDRMRLVGADELVAMAAEAGLTMERLGSDHSLTPFGPGAERAILVGRRSQERLV